MSRAYFPPQVAKPGSVAGALVLEKDPEGRDAACKPPRLGGQCSEPEGE